MNISDLISSRDKTTEQIVLSKILTVQRVPPDLLPDYFQAAEGRLFADIHAQWEKYGKLDIQVLKKDNPDAFMDCLELQGSYTEATLDILHRHWSRREIGKMFAGIGDCENPTEALEEIQAKSANIAFRNKTEDYDHYTQIQQVLSICERGQSEARETVGYTTYLSELDKLINGIEKGKMYAIGALKKTGKSRFMLWLAIKCAEQGAGVMLNTLEMSLLQLNSLSLSHYAGIDSRSIGRKMSQQDYTRLTNAAGLVNNLDWVIYREYTVPHLKARILYERTKRKIDVVFVDYIQRGRASGNKSRAQEVESLAAGLADLSRDLNVAVIVLSQLSGEAERLGDTMPNMSHFKESQAIAEASDVIMTLHNFKRSESPFTEQGSYKLQEVHCRVEQRYDVSGSVIKFLADLRLCRWEDDR